MTETLVAVSPPEAKEPPAGPSPEELETARELLRAARAKGVALTGPDALLRALTKTVIETVLEEEMSEHLGYDKHEFGRGLTDLFSVDLDTRVQATRQASAEG